MRCWRLVLASLLVALVLLMQAGGDGSVFSVGEDEAPSSFEVAEQPILASQHLLKAPTAARETVWHETPDLNGRPALCDIFRPPATTTLRL